MINFFRKIRQSLLHQNRITKYLLYALGEIILVAIGILMALQINNWNEQQKENQLEIRLLKDLKKEFVNNLKAVKEGIAYNLQATKRCETITIKIRNNALNENTAELDSLIVGLGLVSSFDAFRGVVDEMISSGKLEVIKNDSIKKLLTTWISDLENQKLDVKWAVDNYNMNLMPFLITHFPLANGDLYKSYFNAEVKMFSKPSPYTPDYSKINSLVFENQIWNHKHNIDFIIDKDINLQKLVNYIIEKLSKEIELKSND